MGIVLAAIAGLAVGVTSWWHLDVGGVGTSGRPFVIFLALGVAVIFATGAG